MPTGPGRDAFATLLTATETASDVKTRQTIPEEFVLMPSAAIRHARDRWRFTGRSRPDFAEPPAPGQRSVWDFPRPPRIEPVDAALRVMDGKRVIAATVRGVRVLETAGAPTYYFPPGDTDETALEYGEETSVCEWKGVAQSLRVGAIEEAGWRYVRMFEEFASLWCWPSFYAAKLACFIDDERVLPQPGGYYGGWVSGDLAGPMKGDPTLSRLAWSEY